MNPLRNALPHCLLAALLTAAAPSATAASGTWTNLVSGNASGSWATAANWNNGIIASGADATADFSTLSLVTNSTVTLDGARTVGGLAFGVGTPAVTNNWILATGTGGPLTLAVSSGQPTLAAVNGSNNISAVLLQSTLPSGLTKTGNGLIRLSSANLLTNAVHNFNAGIVQLANNSALGFTNTLGGFYVGTNNIATGATLWLNAGVQPVGQRAFIAGAGLGGTNGAIRADAGTGNQQNTRWSFALSSVPNPAFVLTADATIRVDGSGYPTQAGFLVGAITNNADGLNYTLTLVGTGELRVDPPVEIAVAAINVQGGIFGMNGNASTITKTQAVNVASGAVLAARRNHTYSSGNSPLTLNGTFDLNYNSGATANTAGNSWFQIVGSLVGNGAITNSSLAPQLLFVTSGTSNSIFGGSINPGNNGAISLRKEGQNTTMWLTGNSTFAGTNILAGGVQYINGSWNPSGGFQVSAQSGATSATLAGKGGTLSSIFLGNGGAVSAGDPTGGGGTFSVSNILANAGGQGLVIISNANLTISDSIGSAASYLGALYATNGTLTLPLSPSGASVFANSVTVDGGFTLSYSSANPAVGQFPLIAYSTLGGLAGGGTNGLNLIAPAGTTAYLLDNTANSTLDVVVTAVPALKWNGNINGNWNIATTANWLNGLSASTYTETAGVGPFVNFDDSATGSTTVNVAANVTPKGATVNNTTKNYTFNGSGSILGTGGVLKQGSGTLTLANTNAFSGTVNISAGTVEVGNGGTSGNLGNGSVVNSGTLVFNRSDSVTFANPISGAGALVKNGANTVTLSGIGNVGGSIAANSGTLALAPSGVITVTGDVTGSGAFGVNSAGTVKLSSGTITYTGGSVIQGGGTLQFDAAFPPAGNVTDNGRLAFGVGGTFTDIISGSGGITLLNGASLTLSGANTYTGPTAVLGGGTLTADAANYPAASVLILGGTNSAEIGAANFNAGNPVLGGLVAGGNSTSPGDPIALGGSGQTLTVNGSVVVGNVASGASVLLSVTGAGASLTVNTNGGLIQIGLCSTGSGINPDNVLVDFSALDNFTANLGSTGVINMGTTDGNPGPPAGATVVNQFKLAGLTNIITAGQFNVGAGGRQLNPELFLGAGTNILNVNTLSAGFGGRDGSLVHFAGGTGGLKLRAADGVSRAAFLVGNNPATATGANIANSVDFSGHPVDLLISTLNIGNYNNAGTYVNSFAFDTGTLDASSTSLSLIRNNNANAAASGSTLWIGGGVAKLGPVSLTASAAAGTLNIGNADVTVANVTSAGSGLATLNITNSTLSIALTNNGNPVVAPVAVDSLTLDTAVTLNVNGTAWSVGQFPLFSYTGSIGGTGYSALTLASLPSGVGAYLSNNVTALTIDLVVTNAPVLVNTTPTNIVAVVNGSNLELSWPADHIGWRLQAQTNSLNVGLGTNWVAVPGSQSVNRFTNTIDITKPTVFYRLVYP